MNFEDFCGECITDQELLDQFNNLNNCNLGANNPPTKQDEDLFPKFCLFVYENVWIPQYGNDFDIEIRYNRFKQKIARYTLTATIDLVIPHPEITPNVIEIVENFLEFLKSDNESFLSKQSQVQPTITYEIMNNDGKGNVSKMTKIAKDSEKNDCKITH